MPLTAEARPFPATSARGELSMLCLTCRRVRPALSPAEYTAARALLITRHGLCCCAHTVRPAPRRAPAPPAPAATVR